MPATRVQDRRLEIGQRARIEVEAALDKALAAGLEHYRASVPVRTGRLKRATRKFAARKLTRYWGASPSAPHARHVELGTRYMKARPHLSASVQVARNTLFKELK